MVTTDFPPFRKNMCGKIVAPKEKQNQNEKEAAVNSTSNAIPIVSFNPTTCTEQGPVVNVPKHLVKAYTMPGDSLWNNCVVPIMMGISEDRGFLFSSAVLGVGLVAFVAMLAITAILWGMGLEPQFTR